MALRNIDYGELITGYEFEPTSFRLDGESVMAYLDAVEDNNRIYEENRIVPPMAVAALSMTAMAAGLLRPPGAVHVSPDLHFLSMFSINGTFTSCARMSR